MSDDIAVLKQHFNSIRAPFLVPADCRSGLEMDAGSVSNLNDMLAGFQKLLHNFIQELEVLRVTEASRIGQPAASEHRVSSGLGKLLVIMSPHYGSGEVVMPGETYDAILNGLAGLVQDAGRMELQLKAFSGLEEARFASGTIEEVATTAAGDLLLNQEGNVIPVNFGGRT
jgi:hypothetical protein